MHYQTKLGLGAALLVLRALVEGLVEEHVLDDPTEELVERALEVDTGGCRLAQLLTHTEAKRLTHLGAVARSIVSTPGRQVGEDVVRLSHVSKPLPRELDFLL